MQTLKKFAPHLLLISTIYLTTIWINFYYIATFNVDFNKYYPYINNSIDSFERILNNLPKIKDDIDLNRFYKKSLEMLKDKDLYNLSKTNNYFIFKKL